MEGEDEQTGISRSSEFVDDECSTDSGCSSAGSSGKTTSTSTSTRPWTGIGGLSATETLRRAFKSLSLTSMRRESKEAKKHASKGPKCILRTPVSYTYVRGLSGLPTHRVPRTAATTAHCSGPVSRGQPLFQNDATVGLDR